MVEAAKPSGSSKRYLLLNQAEMSVVYLWNRASCLNIPKKPALLHDRGSDWWLITLDTRAWRDFNVSINTQKREQE